MTTPFTRVFVVRWGDVDANHHLRNTAYSEYANDTRYALFQSLGWDWERFQGAGVGPILFRETIEYRREALMGEEVVVDAVLAGLSPDGYRWAVRNRFWKRDGTHMATVDVNGSWIDSTERKLVTPPQALLDGIRSVARAEPFEELPPARRR